MEWFREGQRKRDRADGDLTRTLPKDEGFTHGLSFQIYLFGHIPSGGFVGQKIH